MSKWKVRSRRESVANFVENPGFFDVLKQEKAKVEEVPPCQMKGRTVSFDGMHRWESISVTNQSVVCNI